MKLKFDVANTEFVFNRNDSSFQLGPEAIAVILYQKNGTPWSLKTCKNQQCNTSVKIPGGTGRREADILKTPEKNIEEYNEYGNASRYKRFIEMYEYYIYKDGKANVAPLNKNEL